MKASRFNILISTQNNHYLLFNSASAALAEIEADNFPAVARLLSASAPSPGDSDREFHQVLCDGKFLIPDETDELAELVITNRRQRFAGETLFLTIAPTLSCNFRCEYCFESRQSSFMTRETEDAVLQFAARKAARARNLLVTWFGGEPTLCVDTIARLQIGLREIAQEHSLSLLPTALVTNGYLLDRNLAIKLQSLGITDIQVTLDGPRRIHDVRRRLANGQGSFDIIMSNLRETADLLQITIRVNVDSTSAATVPELIAELDKQELLSRTNLYFAPVNEHSETCPDIRGRCFSTREFAAMQTNFYRELVSTGLASVEYPMLAPGGHCGAASENAFVISPRGDLYKCWEEISLDQSHSIGSVFSETLSPQQAGRLNRFLSWDPFQLSECRGCHVLPLCMGGCPRQGLDLRQTTHGACCSWKYNLEEMLRLHHHSGTRKEVTT